MTLINTAARTPLSKIMGQLKKFIDTFSPALDLAVIFLLFFIASILSPSSFIGYFNYFNCPSFLLRNIVFDYSIIKEVKYI